MDDLKKRGPQDPNFVNVHEAWELKGWCETFGVTPEVLKRTVAEVGPSVAAVRKKLGK